jgi:hypothetical protein
MVEPEELEWVPAINLLAHHAYQAGWKMAKRQFTAAEKENLIVDAISIELIGRLQRGDCG